MLIFVILLALSLGAFFSGAEIAFVVANRLRVEVAARREGLVGPIIRHFLHNPSTLLTTTLVGHTLALVVYATLMAFYLGPPLQALFAGVGLHGLGAGVAVVVALTVVAAAVALALGEVLPKAVMRELANHAVFVLALPLRLSYYLLLPLVKLAAGSASLLTRLSGAPADSLAQFIQRDFEVIAQENKSGGELELDDEETELLSNVFAMNTIRVKESMTPRTDVLAVEEGASLEALHASFVETGHSKLPVYRDNIDHIVGVVFAYDLFQNPASLQEIMRPAQFVPESKRSKDLLREFLATNTSIAIVIDEYGGTAGLVTREDLLEELFGDIQDEFDTDEAVLRTSGPNAYVASGRVHIDELAERFGVVLPEGDYETVAGYLLERAGTIPPPKAEYVLDGYRFVILKSTPSRIDLVRIIRETPPAAEA